MERRFIPLLLALACVHFAAGARPAAPQNSAQIGGGVRGIVRVLRPPAASARRPSIGDLGMPTRAEVAEPSRPIVFVEKAPAGAFEERAFGRARMTQRGETFLPHVLPVHAGTTVEFPNEDQTFHNVFSLSKARRFDLGRYAAGQSKAVRFDQPGIVRVFCDIHSHMSAFILVFNHPYFDAADGNGRYEISGLPPGRYSVAAWHEGSVRATQVATVPDHEGGVELNFELR
jgi:plastocyanin